MRVIVCCLITCLSTGIATAQSRKTTQSDFLIGQVVATPGSQIQIDLGYVHGFKRGQPFAVFRSEALAWSPIGTVEATSVGSTRTQVRITSGAKPRKGDVILVAYATLGHVSNALRDDFYVTRQILTKQYQNGYDTRTLAADARQLSHQKTTSRRWYKQGEDSGVRLTYGLSSDSYKSDRVRNLALQCQLIAELQENAPGAMNSLSARWTQVLPQITGYKAPPEKKPVGEDGEEIDEVDDEFATAVATNFLPLVDLEFENEPRAVREVFAVVLGSMAANPPANTRSYIRSRISRSQFPSIAEQPDTIRTLEEFFSTVQ